MKGFTPIELNKTRDIKWDRKKWEKQREREFARHKSV